MADTTHGKNGPALIKFYSTKVDSDDTFSPHVKPTYKQEWAEITVPGANEEEQAGDETLFLSREEDSMEAWGFSDVINEKRGEVFRGEEIRWRKKPGPV